MQNLVAIASKNGMEINDQLQSSGSRASVSEHSIMNVQPSFCLPQQTMPPLQPSKRIVNSNADYLETQTPKRFKPGPGSPTSPGTLVRSHKSHPSRGISSYCFNPSSRVKAGNSRGEEKESIYVQDYETQLKALELQMKERLRKARIDHDALQCRCWTQYGPECPFRKKASETNQEDRVNDTSSTAGNSAFHRECEAMQVEDVPGAGSNILDPSVSSESQSLAVTAPGKAIAATQQGSTGLGQKTAPVVERDEPHDCTLSRPTSSPTGPVGDAFRSLQHPTPLPRPPSSGVGTKSQSPIQHPNQQLSFFGSTQPAVYYRHEHPLVSQLELLGDGTYRRSIYNPTPDRQKSVPQHHYPPAPRIVGPASRKASEPVVLTDYRPVQIPPRQPEKLPQHPSALVTSAPPYSNVHWLEDSKFVCHFIRAVAAGHFLEYIDLISPVDRGMASAYLWCSLDKDQSWEVIFGAKDSPLTSRHDLEKLLNRWRGGPEIYVQKLPEAQSPSIMVPGTTTQAVAMGINPQAAASPTQGQAINIRLEDTIDRQQAAPVFLFDLLKATHDNASEWSEQLETWFLNLLSTKESLPLDDVALQKYQNELNEKQAEINTLDAKFEDLVQTMPKELLEELQQVRGKSRSTMLRDKEELVRRLDNCLGAMEEKRDRIAKLEECVRSLKSDIPEAIETLKRLEARLPDL